MTGSAQPVVDGGGGSGILWVVSDVGPDLGSEKEQTTRSERGLNTAEKRRPVGGWQEL